MHNNHDTFILKPVKDIYKEALAATNVITKGIEVFPLYEYMMQSIFLKTTGAQEQKLKCICWEIATYDYRFRYQKFRKGMGIGECSDYEDKKMVFSSILNEIVILGDKYENPAKPNIQQIKDEIIEYHERSFFSGIAAKELSFFKQERTILNENQFLTKANNGNIILFQNLLKEKFDKCVYEHRNRCAHNTLSYQENLPTLNELADPDYKYNNYFFRFAILFILDSIITKAYKYYLDLREASV